GVQTPGRIAMSRARQARTSSGFVPGETTKSAPADWATDSCSSSSTVPAPRSISGYASRIASRPACAEGVRKVISTHESPPATSASASGTARSASGSSTTGTTPAWRSRSEIEAAAERTGLLTVEELGRVLARTRHPVADLGRRCREGDRRSRRAEGRFAVAHRDLPEEAVVGDLRVVEQLLV